MKRKGGENSVIMPRAFKKFLWVSIFAHLIVFSFIFHSPELFRLLPKKHAKITWLHLTKGTASDLSPFPFKKADGMPYSTLQEQKQALREISKKKKTKDGKIIEYPDRKRTSKEGGIDFKSKKGTRERTIDDALARVEEELKKREAEMEAAQIEKEGSGQSPYGSLDVREGEMNAALIAYYEELKRKINDQWITTPKTLEEGQYLRTTINVLIDSQGNIISASFESKSTDNSFDLSAMRAIEKAAPFPIPPEEIRREALTEGFLIEFNPRSVVGNY